MEQGFDFYENIYSKEDFYKYADCVTDIASGKFAFKNYQEPLLIEFKNMLNDISKKLLNCYVPKKISKNFELEFKDTDYQNTELLGYTDISSNKIIISQDCLTECLTHKNTATPIGVVIHETSHLIQNLTQNSFSEENKSKNAYAFDLQEWLEDDWFKNTYNNLVRDVVVPFVNKSSNQNLKVSTTKYLPSTILYNHDKVEQEAFKMQAHLQRQIGSILSNLAKNEVAQKNILKNYFSSRNNFSGQNQAFNFFVKQNNYDFIDAVVKLSPNQFAELLNQIKEYSKKFNCKSDFAIKSHKFGEFIRENCINNFTLLYSANNTKETFDEFMKIYKNDMQLSNNTQPGTGICFE